MIDAPVLVDARHNEEESGALGSSTPESGKVFQNQKLEIS